MYFIGILGAVHDIISIPLLIPYVLSDEMCVVLLMTLDAVRLVSLGLMTTMTGLFIVMIVFSITGIFQVSLKSVIYKYSKDHPQGNIQGALGSIRTVMVGFGSVFFSAIYSTSLQYGNEYAWVTFIVGGVIMGVGALYSWRLFYGAHSLKPVDSVAVNEGEAMDSESKALLSGSKG